MIFNNPPRLISPVNSEKYLQNDLWGWMKNLSSGLIRLNLVENFEAARLNDLTIDAGATVTFGNPLPFVPSSRIIVRQVGDGVITDGTWSMQSLSLKNNGAVAVTISIIFYR